MRPLVRDHGRFARGYCHRHSRSVGRSDASRPRTRAASSGGDREPRQAARRRSLGGCLAWGIPLVIASGGVDAYLAALDTPGRRGLRRGWTCSGRTRRRGISPSALYQTLVLPWASIPLALAVGVAAAIGAARHAAPRVARAARARRSRSCRTSSSICCSRRPITVRYALPIVVPVAWLAARGFALARRLHSVRRRAVRRGGADRRPSRDGVAYGRDPHPAFRAIADAVQRAPRAAAGGRLQPLRRAPAPAGRRHRHASRRRAADASYEWLGPVDYWRTGGTAPVWFLADQRRTDLALIDPQSRHDVVRYRWSVEQRPEI